MHASRRIALWHLLVNDSAACRHPLNVPGSDSAVISHAVAVLHCSGKDVRDGFDAAVWMPREASQIVRWNVVAKVVEQKKRVELRSIIEAECAPQMYARTFQR
jgi:hypothetical protein